MRIFKGQKIKNQNKIGFLMLFLALCLLIFPALIYGKPFAEYKQNVNQAKKEFASLIGPTENQTAEEIETTRENIFEKTLKLFPPEETIKAGEEEFEVNNEWLITKIREYKDDKKTAEEKTLILTSVYERLEAIESKLEEFAKANSAETTKDEEKRKLAEILNREEYEKPKIEEESLLQRLWRWFDEWMRKNVRPSRQPLPASNYGSVIYALQWLLYIVIAGLIGFVLYKFAPFFIKKFRQREKHQKNTERYILGEKLAADETSENLFTEAEKLAHQGNLRGAIRKGYIALLFELSERRHIGLAKYKTNRDYLRSLRKKRELHKNMNELTHNYERHWYGFEEAGTEDWEEFKIDYKKALKG